MLLRVKPVSKEEGTNRISSQKYIFKGELFINSIDYFFSIVECRCGSGAELVKTKLNNRSFYTYVRCKACANRGEFIKVSNVSRGAYNSADWWDIAECEDAVAVWNRQQAPYRKQVHSTAEYFANLLGGYLE